MTLADAIREEFPPYGGLSAETVQIKLHGHAPMTDSDVPAEVGWGIIFGPGVCQKIRTYLEESLWEHRTWATQKNPHLSKALLNWRKLSCDPPGSRSAEVYVHEVTKGQQQPGTPVDPGVFPYYILIVADPAEISFQFEKGLAVQNAVGRLWFGNEVQNLGSYQQYVERLIASESATPQAKTTGFLWPESSHCDTDLDTAVISLGQPLTDRFPSAAFPDHQSTVAMWKQQEPPPFDGDLMFSLSHGTFIPRSARRLRQRVRERVLGQPCAKKDRPLGSRLPPDPSCFFSRDGSTRPRGWWAFSCYSAGLTRYLFQFSPLGLHNRTPQDVGDTASAFSRLALHAVNFFIGSVNPVSFLTFQFGGGISYNTHFAAFIGRLLNGRPVGFAKEQVFSSLIIRWLSEIERLKPYRNDQEKITQMRNAWIAWHDLSNIVICGDPAARL